MTCGIIASRVFSRVGIFLKTSFSGLSGGTAATALVTVTLRKCSGERGIQVDHTTIYRWVQKYGPELAKNTRYLRRRSLSYRWHIDETYIKVGGKWCLLYRAIDAHGYTIDFFYSTRRNTTQAIAFLGKALRSQRVVDRPRVIVSDKCPALAKALVTVDDMGLCSPATTHIGRKYLNNRIEGDHGRLKRVLGPKGAFKNPVSAYRTLQGIEVMHSLCRDRKEYRWVDSRPRNVVVVEKAFE